VCTACGKQSPSLVLVCFACCVPRGSSRTAAAASKRGSCQSQGKSQVTFFLSVLVFVMWYAFVVEDHSLYDPLTCNLQPVHCALQTVTSLNL
jgi:hypothetical protein